MAVMRQDTEYAMRLLLLLGASDPGCYVSVPSIAERIGASAAFSHKIVQVLRAAGLVDARRGVAGGVRLAKPLKEISLLEVWEAVQGRFALLRCNDKGSPCSNRGRCHVSRGMRPIEEGILRQLREQSLAKMAGFVGSGAVVRPGQMRDKAGTGRGRGRGAGVSQGGAAR